jgi:hypothetical protein
MVTARRVCWAARRVVLNSMTGADVALILRARAGFVKVVCARQKRTRAARLTDPPQ